MKYVYVKQWKKSDESPEKCDQDTATMCEATEVQKGTQAEHGKNLDLER